MKVGRAAGPKWKQGENSDGLKGSVDPLGDWVGKDSDGLEEGKKVDGLVY